MITNPIEQVRKHDRTSESYHFISSQNIIDAARANGFEIASIKIQRVLNPYRLGFQKHVIKFQKPDAVFSNGARPQLILTNGHDGMTAFRLMYGIYIMACENGLVIGDHLIQPIYFKHNQVDLTSEKIVEGIQEIISHSQLVEGKIEEMRERKLEREEQLKFAFKAGELINWPNNQHELLLNPRRDYRGEKTSLWTCYNVVQENIIKGGIARINDRGKTRRSKGIKDIGRDLLVNRELFNLALAA